jgi:hypothetical protein
LSFSDGTRADIIFEGKVSQESGEMKLLILLTAAAMLISSIVVAQATTTGLATETGGAIIATGSAQESKVAMGPTSAPHKPGGTGTGDNGGLPEPHKKAKHRHKHRSHSRD